MVRECITEKCLTYVKKDPGFCGYSLPLLNVKIGDICHYPEYCYGDKELRLKNKKDQEYKRLVDVLQAGVRVGLGMSDLARVHNNVVAQSQAK